MTRAKSNICPSCGNDRDKLAEDLKTYRLTIAELKELLE